MREGRVGSRRLRRHRVPISHNFLLVPLCLHLHIHIHIHIRIRSELQMLRIWIGIGIEIGIGIGSEEASVGAVTLARPPELRVDGELIQGLTQREASFHGNLLAITSSYKE